MNLVIRLLTELRNVVGNYSLSTDAQLSYLVWSVQWRGHYRKTCIINNFLLLLQKHLTLRYFTVRHLCALDESYSATFTVRHFFALDAVYSTGTGIFVLLRLR
jgi:hypothetical protein